MKYAEIATTASQLTKLRDEHRRAATYFLTLFNRSRIPNSDIHAPMSPLLTFYQTQTEYHTTRKFELDALIDNYQHAVDTTIFE